MPVAYSMPGATAVAGQTSLTFTVSRSGTSADLAQASQIGFETKDDTAHAGQDYIETSGQLYFDAGATENTIVVAIESAAYDDASSTQFYVRLTGSSSATGTIQPTARNAALQSYLVVPEDDVTVDVPTTERIDKDATSGKSAEAAEKAGTATFQTIKYQTDYANLGDSDEAVVNNPFAYIRLGIAGQGMNDYERVVANSPAFHPMWRGWNQGRPQEIGPLSGRMRPRGIDRQGDPKADNTTLDALQKYNANLDGLLLYSGSNYTVSVGRHLNRVVQGDRVQSVGEHASQVVDDGQSVWTYYDGALHAATGLDKVDGQIWQYDISAARELKISTQPIVKYALDQQFKVNMLGIYEVRNDASYTINNGIRQHTRGIAASVNSDILGNFSVNLPGVTHSTSSMADIKISGSQGFAMTVNPELSLTATAAVGVSSGVVAALALGTMSPGFLTRFQSEKSFFKDANSENLGSNYADTFTTALPDSLAALEAINTAIIIAAAISQVCRDWWPSENPLIEGSMTGVRDSVYDFWDDEEWVPPDYSYAVSKIISNIGLSSISIYGGLTELINFTTSNLQINAASIAIGNELVPVGRASLDGGTNSITAPTISIEAMNTTVTPLLEVAGDVFATQAVTGNLLQL